jgi:hypothetical protein
VVTEVAALILEFNEDVLPSLLLLVNAALPFAIRIFSSDGFYEKTRFTADHSEKVDDSLLINGSETQSTKVDALSQADFLTMIPFFRFVTLWKRESSRSKLP